MNNEESLIHVIHGCLYAIHVWIKLVPYNQMTQFYFLTRRDLISYNLKGNVMDSRKDH